MPLGEKTVTGIGHNYSVMAARLTLKSINDELVRRGHNARLEKASGYFYFFGDEAADWLDRTPGTTVNSRSLDQWVEEFKRLKKLNQMIMGSKLTAKRP